jgi:hypothetical protein
MFIPTQHHQGHCRENAKQLILDYLLGARATSISHGLSIVLSLTGPARSTPPPKPELE